MKRDLFDCTIEPVCQMSVSLRYALEFKTKKHRQNSLYKRNIKTLTYYNQPYLPQPNPNKPNLPQFFKINNVLTSDKMVIAQAFNKFF